MTVTTPPATLPPERLPLDDPRRRGARPAPQPFAPAAPAAPAPALAVPADGSDPPPPPPLADDGEDFVDPDATKRLGADYGLPAGRWIEVRRALNWAQAQQLQMEMIGGNVPADALTARGEIDLSKVKIDTTKVNVATVLAWVVAWNLTHQGAVAPLDDAHVRGLSQPRAAQLLAAIQRHVEEGREGNAGPSPAPGGGSTSES
jgi:hypothetical protein